MAFEQVSKQDGNVTMRPLLSSEQAEKRNDDGILAARKEGEVWYVVGM